MRIISKSIKDTLSIGRTIAKYLKKGDIVCLFGQLGSGKTVLTKGIAAGLGIKTKNITSPSFVLIREYPVAKLPLYHFDLYRLEAQDNILLLGYEEYFYNDGVTVIEWADRLKYLTPGEFLKIELFIRGNKQRAIKFSAFGRRYKELLCRINEDIGR